MSPNDPQPPAPQFPCDGCPEDVRSQRLLGIYDQVQDGLHMQRVKVHAGRISPSQLRAVAELARAHTPGYPLHLTTRQDVELHGLEAEDVPAVQHALERAGLTSLASGGDTLRNVTACPGSGLCRGSADAMGIADAVRRAAEALPGIRNMPRKFKICVSGCPRACARPWITDLGIVANGDGSFRVIGAGSLGARPATGVELYASLPAGQLVPLVVGALRLFEAEGDRTNRSRARLRHVRERLGDAEFRRRLDEAFRAELAADAWPSPPARQVEDEGVPIQARLLLPRGDMEPDLAVELADAAEAAGAVMRIGFEHDVWLYGPAMPALGAELSAMAAALAAVTACPGSTWCLRGLADTRSAADRVRAALPDGAGLAVSISGCPNNCSHAAVCDVGLVGRAAMVDGRRAECFRLLAGGDKGRGPRLAREVHAAVPADRVGQAVSRLAALYAGSRRDRESFAEFVERRFEDLQGEAARLIPS